MYSLSSFKEKDPAVVLEFMKANSFAMLMAVDAGQRPVATQIPFLLEEREGQLYLRGHIMKGNDHHRAVEQNKQVLVVFTGPHCYVSASWYEPQHQQTASTWNYMSVHARGELRFLSEEELLQVLDDTTSFYENNPASPSLYKEMSPDYVQRMAKAIVAFEIQVNSLEHVFKLSQNRDQKTYENILAKLDAGDPGAQGVAHEMRKRKDQLFAS
jgi:transcriptional regulator